MKIGVICELTNNAYYRALIPLGALEMRGHTILWPSTDGKDVPMRELCTCDLVHCYRRIERVEDLRRLSRHGVAVSFDNDDNFAAAQWSERGPGLAGNRHNKAIFRRIVEMARCADVTTTPSAELADIYRAAGVENVMVLGNHLDRGMFGFGSRSRHEGVVVGWVAAKEHSVDLERVPIVDALRRLLDTHPEVRVLTLGMRLPLRSQRYEHIGEVEFPRLLTVTGRMDVGIAPLADIVFNHSRSDSKIKEYSSGGAAWLASPVAPYRGLGEQEGGMLVADDEWFAAIDSLVRAPRLRRRLAKKALKWAKQQTMDRHVEAWEQAFQAAVARTARHAESVS